MSISTRQYAVKSPKADLRTPAGDVLTSLIVPVIQLRALFTRAGETMARTGGQTLARWLVLESVTSGPLTVPQIARALQLTRQSVQRIADLLERHGLAEYVDNPEHQRSKLLRITSRGQRALRAIQSAQRAWADSLGAEIGEADLRHASRVVNRLTRALEAAQTRRRSNQSQ
jgi:DNA-binding MarR family transcriptional regulator